MATQRERTFDDVEAKPGRVPLLVGLAGPSGSGKTCSALRVAGGIQRVVGGDIFVIDTEAGRARHYADSFKFRHVDFGEPFGPLDYLAAIEHCTKKGAGVIVIDSGSHEHEGPGGVLEQHAAEVERMSNGEDKKAERVKMLAWGKPKAARRRLIQRILQVQVPTIWCFRAKEKLEVVPGKEPVRLGWMPIAGDDFLYEMTVRALLEPMCDGVPNWAPLRPGEREWTRVPRQFRELFNAQSPHALCESDGERMARWAMGETANLPRFGGQGEWRGRPLSEAPVDVLIAYKDACNKALASKRNGEAERIKAHIADVDAAIEAKIAASGSDDFGMGGDGYSANEAEAEAMATAND